MKCNKLNLVRRLTGQSAVILVFYFTAITFSSAQSELPNVNLRFENPVFDAETKRYFVDVEFQSSTENISLFGMNVRFFYEKDVIDFISFTDFSTGYGPINPDPPLKRHLAQGSSSLFGFKNDAVFINGAVQLINPNAKPVSITTGQWTKIFSVCFNVSDSKHISGAEFKPQIVWDLEENPLNGGFVPGSEGVVITVIKGDSNIAARPVLEKVRHHNWSHH